MAKGGNGGGGGGTPGGGGATTPVITGIGDTTQSTGSHSTDDRTLTLWGTSDPNTTVVIYVDGTRLGTAISDSNGEWTYTTTELANGSYDFTAETGKGKSKLLSAPYTVEIAGANTPPAATDDNASVAEDSSVTVTVLSNDSDADGDTLTVTSVGAASHGSVTLNGNGTITYAPEDDWFGTDSFTYTISDSNGGTSTATVTVTVDPVNDAPVASDDSASTAEDTSVGISVLANDTDTDGDGLSVTGVGTATNGSAVLNGDGTITYTPNANWSGIDTFTYDISDGNGGTSTATVTVTVNPVNDAPIATADSASTSSGTPVNITVLSNDTDPDGDALSVTAVGTASNGTVTLNGDGTITYNPNAGFSGQDSFSYTLSDGSGGEDTGTVTVTVSAGNTPPTAVNDSASTDEDTPVTVTVLGNDSDTDGDTLSVTGVGAAGNGSVTLNGNGTITYTPNANWFGTDSFTYNVFDGTDTSTATVTVTVDPVNDGPTAAPDSTSTTEDTPVAFNVLGNDSDPEGDTLTLVAVADPAHGSVSFSANGTITYTPDADWSGTDTIQYTVSDGTDTSTGFLTVTVDAANDAPDAGDDAVTTNEDTPVTISVLSNDSDTDGDSLSVTAVGTAANGTVTLNANGTITYTPFANWSGEDSFTYDISDGNGGTDTATVTVTVAPVNDAPTAAADSLTLDEDTTASIAVLANDSDPEGNPLTVSILSQGANGTATVNPDGTIQFAPNADFNGQDSFTYQISDGNGGTSSATVTVTVNPVNDAPTAANDSASTDRDTAVILSVLANDTDVDGDPLTVTGATNGANGTVTVNPDGSLTYNPNAGFTGVDNFTYTVSDGNGGTDTATVTVTVNDPTPPAPDARFTPTDPLYAEQWHLAALGDIERVWAEYIGAGVHVAIYDDGMEYQHTDLDDNYVSMAAFGFPDPAPTTDEEAKHGTSVAGVIAAEANGEGTVGVAFGTDISAVNIFTGSAAIGQAGFNTVINSQDLFDVTSHSWGFVPTTGWYQNDTNATVSAIVSAHADAAINGRGGLGTSVVVSAGNYADTSQGDAVLTTRHTIAVAAYDSGFDASYYTSRGANLLVSAPSSGYTGGGDLRIPTTDRLGEFGYVPEDWSNSANGFGGTSSAAPTVAGVITLMLDANPDIGWRDVQNILAYSSRHIGGEIGVQDTTTETVPIDADYDFTYESLGEMPIEYYRWDYNGADNWNGGGLHFSQDYGFGAVDVYNAVRMAQVWSLFGPAQTSANESTAGTGTVNTALGVSGNGDTDSYTFTYSGNAISLDYVDISISLSANLFEEVSLQVTSPDGTTISLMDPLVNDYTPGPFFFFSFYVSQTMTWTFGANAFKGEDPNGIWTVTLTEVNTDFDIDNYGVEASGITLNSIELDFYGREQGDPGVNLADDVYHYTDEAFETLTIEPGRLNLADGGGNDWLDMAAMTGDLTVNLASNGSGGASAAPGGAFIDIATGTQIENAVTGDGDDLLTGNAAANQLAGMRGDDEYWGLGGGDTFIYFAGGGQDLIWDFDYASTTEVIELHGFSYDSFGDLTLVDLGGTGTLIDLSLGDAAGDQITLAGVNYLNLGDDDFVFV